MQSHKKPDSLDYALASVGGECLKGSKFENERSEDGFVAESVAVDPTGDGEEEEANRG
jgi:hypothetical protein